MADTNNYSIQNMKKRQIKDFVVEQQTADSYMFKLCNLVKKEYFRTGLTNGWRMFLFLMVVLGRCVSSVPFS